MPSIARRRFVARHRNGRIRCAAGMVPESRGLKRVLTGGRYSSWLTPTWRRRRIACQTSGIGILCEDINISAAVERSYFSLWLPDGGTDMNAVTDACLVNQFLTSQVDFAAVFAVVRSLERPRPTMTWHIDRTSGRPVANWVTLLAGSAIVMDEC